jgi:hypothetical protein
MTPDLHRERAYFLAHQQTLSQLYAGRIVIIKGDVVLATFDDTGWAAPTARKRYGGGSYFVQKVEGSAPAPSAVGSDA